MTQKPSSTPLAGGAAIALCAILGVVIGAVAGQPSMGFLGGVGLGVAIAVATWLWDKRRR
ncbi:hypothetical protein [Sphingomonas cavernae]|uniref:Uncharacterized protein n=1 Tax=Sphingomonas cavernae TaxID=2320861 RepID=A0A418WNF2_9SPHN|nr:hypothetical protein [Sphingomonas cavernae]RJF91522.1 hypothetical protein D3876_10845 [Sphingomonas cavernae]